MLKQWTKYGKDSKAKSTMLFIAAVIDAVFSKLSLFNNLVKPSAVIVKFQRTLSSFIDRLPSAVTTSTCPHYISNLVTQQSAAFIT